MQQCDGMVESDNGYLKIQLGLGTGTEKLHAKPTPCLRAWLLQKIIFPDKLKIAQGVIWLLKVLGESWNNFQF